MDEQRDNLSKQTEEIMRLNNELQSCRDQMDVIKLEMEAKQKEKDQMGRELAEKEQKIEELMANLDAAKEVKIRK